MTTLRPVAGLPGLDEVAAHPDRVGRLSHEQVQQLLIRHAAVAPVLLGRMLACEREAPQVVAPPAGPILGGHEAAAYLRIKKSRLDTLRRDRRIRAVRVGKDYTYMREDLDRLREDLASC